MIDLDVTRSILSFAVGTQYWFTIFVSQQFYSSRFVFTAPVYGRPWNELRRPLRDAFFELHLAKSQPAIAREGWSFDYPRYFARLSSFVIRRLLRLYEGCAPFAFARICKRNFATSRSRFWHFPNDSVMIARENARGCCCGVCVFATSHMLCSQSTSNQPNFIPEGILSVTT